MNTSSQSGQFVMKANNEQDTPTKPEQPKSTDPLDEDLELSRETSFLNIKATNGNGLTIDTASHPAKNHRVNLSPGSTGYSMHFGIQSALTTTAISTVKDSPSRESPISPGKAALLGNLIMRKKGSIAFFIDMLNPDKHPNPHKKEDRGKLAEVPTDPQTSPRSTVAGNNKYTNDTNSVNKNKEPFPLKKVESFPKIDTFELRPSPAELKSNLESKIQSATTKRARLLQDRKLKLSRQAQAVRLRILIHESRQRLETLRIQAKSEYNSSNAQLNHQRILRQTREKFSAKVEHAKRVMLIQKMKKFMELRKSLSENFVDLLRQDFLLEDTQLSPKGLDVTIEENEEYLDSSRTWKPNDSPTTVTTTSPTKKDMDVFPSDEQKAFHEEYTSSKAVPSSFLFESPVNLSEPLATMIRRTKSLPDVVLKDTDDVTFLELLNLLPPVTRFTLRELEMDEILSNAQLRHDIIFDSDLQFKPGNDDDDEEASSIAYWDELQTEVSEGQLYRIPLLLAEVRAILIELLPNGTEIKDEIMSNIDTLLISQQIEHGIMNPTTLIAYLADLMKVNCAPIRDTLVDKMVQFSKEGDIVKTMKTCFDILEFMKLVIQLQVLIYRTMQIINYLDYDHISWNTLSALNGNGLNHSMRIKN
ncbi:T-complex protein 11-domain-containing protein [Globomyces pollinis-pini]|nr:T-complex protein 11-domain-containing protein [Globomyces pollinis-pini]